MSKCEMCPRRCGIDRNMSVGYCGAKQDMIVNTYQLFYYEEPCVTGKGGSGAIFFSGCSLKCVYCQNYEISHQLRGETVSERRLAEIFKELEEMGAENINLVTPTHFADQIAKAVKIYRPKIPIVWNTHGYETREAIEKVSEFVDIFLTDFKYFNQKTAQKYSKCQDYPQVAKQALELMVRKKPLIFDGGKLVQGVIVRHLVLPLHTQESKDILNYIKFNYGKRLLVSVMSQFTPFGECDKHEEINRKLTRREYEAVFNYFMQLELDGYFQQLTSSNTKYIPIWK